MICNNSHLQNIAKNPRAGSVPALPALMTQSALLTASKGGQRVYPLVPALDCPPLDFLQMQDLAICNFLQIPKLENSTMEPKLRLRPWRQRFRSHFFEYRRLGFGRIRALYAAWQVTWAGGGL